MDRLALLRSLGAFYDSLSCNLEPFITNLCVQEAFTQAGPDIDTREMRKILLCAVKKASQESGAVGSCSYDIFTSTGSDQFAKNLLGEADRMDKFVTEFLDRDFGDWIRAPHRITYGNALYATLAQCVHSYPEVRFLA